MNHRTIVTIALAILDAANAVAQPGACICQCDLGPTYGYEPACNHYYQSPDDGHFYCHDAGFDFIAPAANSVDTCMAVENQHIPCQGWRLTGGILADPMAPPPAAPVWVTGGTLDFCGYR